MTATIAGNRRNVPTPYRIAITLALALVSFVASTQVASAELVRARDVPLSIRAFDVAAADFNRDRKVDLALPDQDHAVVIRRGRGDGTFARPRSFDVGSDPTRLAVADLNRDGRKDIVAKNLADQTVSVLLARRGGGFRRAVDYGVGEHPSGPPAIGRLNGDRWPDLAVTNRNDDDVTVRLGTGHGKFGRRHDFPTGDTPESVAIADFDGDRKRDLAVADLDRPAILDGRGDGTFRRPRYVRSEALLTLSDIVASRINRDRAVDLLVTSVNFDAEQGVHAFLGRGDGTFRYSKQYGCISGSPTKVAATNMIGDRHKDLAVVDTGDAFDEGPGSVCVLRGKGDGSFTYRSDFAQRLDGAGGRFAIADLNGDGRRDIAVVTYAPRPKLEIFLSE